MTKTAETLKLELAQLSIEERAALAYFLIHSLDGADDVTDSDAEELWDIELNQRLQEINSNSVSGEPAGSVFSKLREKYE